MKQHPQFHDRSTMKKISFGIAITIVVLSSFAVKAAAQNVLVGRTNIPFAFSAEGQQLSAGNYELLRISDNKLVLRNLATAKAVMLYSPQVIVASDTVKLIFRKYDADHFLAGVVAPSYEVSLPKSESEKQVEAKAETTKTIAVQAKH
jgi:hypothetical protein